MGLEFDISEIESALNQFAMNAESAISLFASSAALELENYAKQNRPWTDRTGAARQRLKGTVDHPTQVEWVITLSHGVDYGIYLEFAHERKYAIIYPTLQLKSQDIMTESFQGLITKLWANL